MRTGQLYIFPCGIFETDDYTGQWYIYRYRLMPCTPSGDQVSTHKTKKEAQIELEKLGGKIT